MTKQEALLTIEEKKQDFIRISDEIWDHPETSFQEFFAADTLSRYLEEQGFQVKRGLAGIDTAFSASYGTGKPVIGILGEFDALFGMSQESGCLERKSLVEGGNGHGCGHNLLGAGAVAGAMAVKSYLEENGKEGTVIYFGCPGEEGGSGKTFMAREGVFDQVDCAFTWHPNTVNIVPASSTLANYQIRYSFKGRSAHAASGPYLGRSALDALELMNVGVQFLREHVKPDVRIHYAITNPGGQSPNVVQADAEAVYLLRAPRAGQLTSIYERVNDIARGAALMTGTTASWKLVKACSNILPNFTLCEVMQKNMEEAGLPIYTDEEYAYLKKINDTVSEKRNILEDAASMLGKGGREIMARCKGKSFYDFVVPFFPINHVLSSSTDVGDVSFVCPLAQVATATASANTPVHSWQLTSQGKSSVAHKGMLFAGTIIGGSVIDMMEAPEILKKAREEWRERLEEQPYTCPIPKEVKPTAGPVD